MKHKELEHIIAEGENYLVEFKEQINKSLARELTAFANGSGGRIFLGIDDQRVIKNIEDSNKLHSQIQDIAFNCQPQIPIHLSPFENILIITIPEGKDKPYQCGDGFFIRMGANSQKMSRDQLIDFLQAEGKLRFEEQFHPRFNFEKHYNPERLDAFLRMAGIPKELDDKTILENLGVAERLNNSLKMKNVGVLFFSKSIEFLCEQSTITCVTFEGIDRFQVVNRKDYQEDLITNINMTMHFIKQELKVRYQMTGELRRKEVYELPLEAIREALVNAVSHRDYLQTGCHTTVEIFDDRIEIGNPGGLPKGLTEKDFGKKAVRRNQIVASLLHRVDLVENLGTGIAKIRRMCKEAGCHEPKFTFDSFFTVIFNRDSNEQFNPPSDGGLNLENGGLSKGQYSLLIIIQTNPGIQVKTISEQLHRSLNTLDKQIKKLIEKGFIERRGSKKTGGYWPGRTRRNKNEY